MNHNSDNEEALKAKGIVIIDNFLKTTPLNKQRTTLGMLESQQNWYKQTLNPSSGQIPHDIQLQHQQSKFMVRWPSPGIDLTQLMIPIDNEEEKQSDNDRSLQTSWIPSMTNKPESSDNRSAFGYQSVIPDECNDALKKQGIGIEFYVGEQHHQEYQGGNDQTFFNIYETHNNGDLNVEAANAMASNQISRMETVKLAQHRSFIRPQIIQNESMEPKADGVQIIQKPAEDLKQTVFCNPETEITQSEPQSPLNNSSSQSDNIVLIFAEDRLVEKQMKLPQHLPINQYQSQIRQKRQKTIQISVSQFGEAVSTHNTKYLYRGTIDYNSSSSLYDEGGDIPQEDEITVFPLNKHQGKPIMEENTQIEDEELRTMNECPRALVGRDTTQMSVEVQEKSRAGVWRSSGDDYSSLSRFRSKMSRRTTNNNNAISQEMDQSENKNENAYEFNEAQDILKRKSSSNDMFSPFSKNDKNDGNIENQPQMQSKALSLKYFDKKSLFIFSQTSRIRIQCSLIAKSLIFNYFILFCVFLNSILLAFYHIEDHEVDHNLLEKIDFTNQAFTFVYIIEAFIKIIHQGFILHKKSYIRSGWQIIDVLVILPGIVELFISPGQSLALRVLRKIFRPLKAINHLPSLKTLLRSLIGALPEFGNVGVFLVFVFVLFATIGLQQYNGAFYNTCKYSEAPENEHTWKTDMNIKRVCTINGLGNYQCPAGYTCGNIEKYEGISLKSEHFQEQDYINFGMTNFDHLGNSLFTVFEMITCESWYYILVNMMDVDFPIFGVLYCLLVIIVGQFFLLNLILAVIIDAFISDHHKQLEQEIQLLEQDNQLEGTYTDGMYETDESSSNENDFSSSSSQTKEKVEQESVIVEIYKVEESDHAGENQYANNSNNIRRSRTFQKDDVKNQSLKEQRQGGNMKKKNTEKLNLGSIMNSSNKIVNRKSIYQKKGNVPIKNIPKKTKQFIEEERKYQNNEDFTAFLRGQARKRRVANMFFKIKDAIAQEEEEIKKQESELIEDQELMVADSVSEVQFMDQPQITSSLKESSMKDDVQEPMKSQQSIIPTRYEELKLDSRKAKVIFGKASVQNLHKENREDLESIKKRKKNAKNKYKSQNLISEDALSIQSGTKIIKKGNSRKQSSKQILFNFGSRHQNDTHSRKTFSTKSRKQLFLNPIGIQILEDVRGINSKKSINKQQTGRRASLFAGVSSDVKEDLPMTSPKNASLMALMRQKINLQIRSKEQQEPKTTSLSQLQLRRQSNKCADFAFRVTEHPIYSGSIFLTVILNIVILALDSYPVNVPSIYYLEYFNNFYSLVIVLELIFKISAIGFKNYFKGSFFNKFDCIIVMISLIDISLVRMTFFTEQRIFSGVEITILRAFRIVRLFKIASYWRNFQILLQTLLMSLINSLSIACLLIIIMYVYTLLGHEFFANKAHSHETGGSPLFNFDNFRNSITTVFIILTNDAQSIIYFSFNKAVGYSIATIFWVTYVIFAQKILLNVFLAILLQNFNDGTIKYKIYAEEEEMGEQFVRAETRLFGLINKQFEEAFLNIKVKFSDFIMKIDEAYDTPKIITNSLNKSIGMENQVNRAFNNSLDPNSSPQPKMIAELSQSLPTPNQMSPIAAISPELSTDSIPDEEQFRREIRKIIRHPKYDAFIVICIITSSVQLALDKPTLDPDSDEKNYLFWVDIATMGIFTIEAISKIYLYGFLFKGKHSYLRGIWNILDFAILISSYLCLTPLIGTFKVIKALRILRSLRIVSRNENLKVAVRALFFAIPNILNITIIMVLFFMIFAVIGVSFFKGKLFRCVNLIDPHYHVTTKWDCINHGGIWKNRIYNFDNIRNALATLFLASTTAGWGEIMYDTIASTEIDHEPNHKDSHRDPAWIAFFILFMIIGFFFFLNLFIGVVINTFKNESDRVGGTNLLTDKQKEWIDLKLLVLRSGPIKQVKPPGNIICRISYFIMKHHHFEKVIQICIILNTLVLMLKWYRSPDQLEQITELLNYVFSIIFIVEAFIRITATSPSIYFKDEWNIFDFIVAMGSVIGFLVSLNTNFKLKATTLLRAFRILRLLRLLKRGGNSLYLIFNTFVITMQSLANIGGLLILIMYIYSIIGMIFFGEVKRNGNMNDYINFENFPNAFITLFTVATVDLWHLTMASFAFEISADNDCVKNPAYEDFKNNDYKTIGCGNQQGSFLFFITYMYIVSHVFLKLFIAIILDGYNRTRDQDNRLFNNEMRERFREVWAEFDPEATCFIKLADIRNFLFALGGPLGFDETFQESRFLQDKFIASLDLPTYQNFHSYQFLDILDALSFRLMVMGHINKIEEDDAVHQAERELNKQASLDEVGFKNKIEKEVNRLIFQKQSENIVDFKELWEKEQKKKAYREKNKDQTGLTSSHHMALEAAIRRIKVVLAEKRQARIDKEIILNIERKPTK